MQFNKEYFDARKYSTKERLVKRHILEVLEWASKAIGKNLLIGEGRTALDVGCAFGFSSSVLEKLGYKVSAVDLLSWGLRNAKKVTNGDFLVCDAQTNLPFRDGNFDLVTCFDVLEHLKFPEQAIQNMVKVCAGSLVCTTPNGVVDKPVKKIIGDYDETHINVRSAPDWEKLIVNMAHPKMVKVDTFLDFSGNLGQKLLFKSIKLPKFGLTVRIVARCI